MPHGKCLTILLHSYFALEEGAFVTWYGSDANFFTKDQWKSQLNTLNEIKNYNVFFQSDTKLNPVKLVQTIIIKT
ncbi:hypothetical protein MASR2M47_21160 [Draconibacterium sp.]